jgi:ribose transport system permease protein
MSSQAQNAPAPPPGLLGKVHPRNKSAIEVVQDLGLVAILVICSILLGLASPVFFTGINIENLLFSSTIIAVVAIGEAFVIMVSGIDLSVGAVLALSSVLCVGLAANQGFPVWLSTLVALLVGAGVGFINGVSVTRFKIPPLIATLAMMSIARGVAFIYSGGRNIAPIPDIFSDIQEARLFGIPVIILFTIIIALIAHFVLSNTRFGREIYATGGNPIAATIGGLMITARLEAGAATAGFGTELTVISAVVIGGVSLFGGEGKIGSVMLGVLLLGLVQNAINLLNVPPNYDYIVSGLVIALAAALDDFRRKVAEKGARRRAADVKKEQAGRSAKAD